MMTIPGCGRDVVVYDASPQAYSSRKPQPEPAILNISTLR